MTTTIVGVMLLLSQTPQTTPLWWTLQGGQTWQYSRTWLQGSPELWLFPSEQWIRQSQLEGEGGLRDLFWKARIREVHPSGEPPYIWIQLQRGHSRITMGDLTEEDRDIEEVDPGRQQGIDVRYRSRTRETEILTLLSSSLPYREFLRGTGSTGPYRLEHTPVIPGSERVIRWRNTQPETLVLHRDYELSPLVGEIILRGGPLFPEEMLEVYYRARGHGVGLYALAQSWQPSSHRLQGGWIQAVDSTGTWQTLYFGRWGTDAWGLSLTDLRGTPDAFRIQGHGRWEGKSSSMTFRAGWVDPDYTVPFTRNVARGGWFEGELQQRWHTFLQTYQGAYRRDQQWERGTHTWTLQREGAWGAGIAVLWDRATEKKQQLRRETHGLRWTVHHTGMETSLEWREGVDDWRDSTGHTQSWWTWQIHASGTGWTLELEQEWSRSQWQHTARASIDRTAGSWNTGALLIFRKAFDGNPQLSLEGHLEGKMWGWFTNVQWNRDYLFRNAILSSEGFERLYMEGQHGLREGELHLMYNHEVGLRRVFTGSPFFHNHLDTWGISFTEGRSPRWRIFFNGSYTRTKDVDTMLALFSEHLVEGKGTYSITREHAIEMAGRWHERCAYQDTLPWKGEQRKVQIRGVQTLGAGHGSLGLIVLDSTRLDTSLFYWWRTGLQLSASRPGRLSLEPALLVARNMISNIPHPFWSVRADITFNLYAFVLVRLHLWDEVSGTQFHYRGAECTLGTTLRGIDGQVRYWLQEDLLFQSYRAELHATLGMHF